MNGRRRLLFPALAALALAAVTGPAASAAVQDPIPIGPNMYFVGLINGATQNAVIKVVCPGPVVSGETGHPISGQTVEVETVLPPVPTTVGYTGSAADSIDAIFGPLSSSTNEVVKLTSFFAPVAIPTSLVLPCSGSGVVTFVPLPTSSTARNATVTVTYLNIAV
jgi:hypothetical protein